MTDTPLTITVIAWNYCNNSCSYCVSESNKTQWNFNGNFEVWKPEGEEHLNFYELADKYGLDYHEKMCPDKEEYLNAKDILDFDAMINWVKEYRPDAHIHISGGEPLLRPDIEEQVAKVCKEFPTTIVTNGQLISERPKLLELQVKWLVSYHIGQVHIEKFLDQVKLIKDKPHLITCILKEDQEGGAHTFFNGYNFEYRYDRMPTKLTDFKYDPEDLQKISSNKIMLIEPNGPVNGCNKVHRGPYHRYKSPCNIYTLENDEDYLSQFNERAAFCVMNNRCSAYQTAVKMSKL